MRRAEIPTVNPARWMEKAGFLRHFADMDDLARWRWMRILFLRSGPPTQDGIDRCAAFANYRLRKGTTWTGVRRVGSQVELRASDGSVGLYDFLVLGTGYVVDVRRRPELSSVAAHIALWQDRLTPPPALLALAHPPVRRRSRRRISRTSTTSPIRRRRASASRARRSPG